MPRSFVGISSDIQLTCLCSIKGPREFSSSALIFIIPLYAKIGSWFEASTYSNQEEYFDIRYKFEAL